MTPAQLLTAQFNVKSRIAKLQRRLDKLQTTLDNYEPDPSLFENQFNDFLDEPGLIKILDSEFYPAHILKELDRSNYDCQLSEFIEGLTWGEITDTDPTAAELEEEFDELEARIDRLQDHKFDIDDMIEDLDPNAA